VNGTDRIAESFARARADGRRAALMPYLMAGYPDPEASRGVIRAYVRAGADLIELGIPFSDPLADGPVIHAAGVQALRAGVRVDDALAIAREVSEQVPVVAMCYTNPILARGAERFLDSLLAASICGLIVPDLPVEEADDLRSLCDQRGLALVPLVAPTTPEDRLVRIGAQARGFVYAVSLTGTTGERSSLDQSLSPILARVAAHTEVPVAVGFGIATPEQVGAAAQAGADGVIVGSRLVRAAGEDGDPEAAVGALVRSFAQALS
jgi:tryptophan synthase alpha chain